MPKMVFSHSRLEAFENCPLKFKFEYIDKIQTGRESIESFMGSRVHETLEKLYRDKRFQKEDSLQELLDFYSKQWDKNWHDGVHIVRKEYSAENYEKMGEQYVAEYFNQYKPFNQSKTLGLEEKVSIDLGDGHRLRGIIDRLALAGDLYEVHDYKTKMNPPSQEEIDLDRQLALYAIAVKKRFPDAEKIDLVWHYLSIGKEMRSKRTEEQLENLKREVKNLIEKIELAQKENDFPAKESALCAWCEFGEFCPKQKHLLATENLSPKEFLEEDGVKLVNKYARLESLKKEFLEKIEPEIETVKKELFEFSRQNGVQKIAGSDFIATLASYPHLSFPEESRMHIRKILEENGKLEEVLDINYYELAKKLNSKEWDSRLTEKLLEHAIKGENKRVYLKKTKTECD
ncbi:MAG: PD-(D/E)XK nuclease family protein [Candidatus Diapherotrites archaeon]